jgi:hypothetical protein
MKPRLESNMKVLALSSNYEPLGVIPWERAINLIFSNKVYTLEEYDSFICSPSTRMKAPAVILFKGNKKTKYKRSIRFSRRNVWIRDEGKCQYCNGSVSFIAFTIDHVIPKTKNGKTVWENVVTCCYTCNQIKGEKSLKEINFKLLKIPKKPNKLPYLQEINDGYYNINNIPESWKFYLERT